MTGQMARFYGLPLRASNACASNAPDAQAMWESMNSLWAAVQSGVNLVYHAAGWLEGGLIASYEKFVMDCEVLQQIQRYFEPILTDASPEALAFDAIAEVGPQGHFFGAHPHPEPLRGGVLRAIPQRLAQLRGLVRGGRGLDRGAGEQDVEGDPRRLRGPADGAGRARRTRRLRCAAQARGRIADRLLKGVEVQGLTAISSGWNPAGKRLENGLPLFRGALTLNAPGAR